MVIFAPSAIPHLAPGTWVWSGGMLGQCVPVRGERTTYLVAWLTAGEGELIRLVVTGRQEGFEEDALVMVGGYVEHPTDGSDPCLIVTAVRPAGFDD